MHIEVVYVPAEADALWLRERLEGVRAPRVVLVLPEHAAGALASPLVWKRLAHRAHQLGLLLAVVAPNREWRWVLQQAGVPILGRVEHAWQRPWRVPRRRVRFRRRRGRAALREWRETLVRGHALTRTWERWLALGLVALVMGVVLALTLPRARVRLPVRAQVRTWQTRVLLAPEFERALFTLPGLPVRPLQVDVEAWRLEPATGRARVPVTAASVPLLWTNLTDRPITLPEGLRVEDLEGAMAFVLVEEGHLPPGPGTTVVLWAQAVRPGEEGNLPAHRLQRLPPAWSWRVTVTNPEPAQGGQDREVITWRPADVERGRRFLEQAMLRHARRALERLSPAQGLVLPETLQLETVLEERITPPEGTPAGWVLVYQRRRYQVWAIPQEPLRQLVAQGIQARTPAGATWWPDSLRIRVVLEEPGGSPPFRARLTARWWELPDLPPDALARGMAARPVAWVLQAWAPWTAPRTPQVDLWPERWPWMPLAFRIRVDVQPWVAGE